MPHARLIGGFRPGLGGRKSFEFAIPDCGLEVGVAVDVTNGCASPPLPPPDCQERDIWQLEEDDEDEPILRWGHTTIDRCRVRPTSFDPVALVRP